MSPDIVRTTTTCDIPSKEHTVLHSPLSTNDSPDSFSESDDPISEFEMNLRKLMLGLLRDPEARTVSQQKGTRRSERIKKPSSRFNEEAGYIAEPPKSAKKRAPHDTAEEGTASKPLLISDWSNAQLACYCDVCGISFTESVSECLQHIRSLEQSLSVTVSELVSSLEDRVA